MKKYIQILTVGAFLMGGLSSCNDFLDREPLDKITPENFFSSEADLAAYSINNYNFNTVTSNYGINFFGQDNNTDNQAGTSASTFWIPGQKLVPSGTDAWDWTDVRSCNYFFDKVMPKYKAGSITGSSANIDHYIGEMYVNRAYVYFDLLRTYGDLPIIKTALNDVQSELLKASVRQPRHLVARFIIEDLKEAEKLLKTTSPAGKNRISKNVATLLRARVALYEATWEKYHKGTAFVPGTSTWPGKDAQGYDADKEIAYFLDEAIDASKTVGDQVVGNLVENTDTREGMNSSLVSLNPYYTMFCDENMENYSEILMWKQFSIAQSVTNNLQMELERNGGGSGWTRGMVNSFLMRNGLPIYASGSGYNAEVEKEGVNKTLEGRDSRISIFTKQPGDVNYYIDSENYDTCKIDLIFGTSGSNATTGFIVKKGKHYSAKMANNHNSGTSGGIVFRATEAMLIYMEASYEKKGNIDATAGQYWAALRTRAKVDPDYNKTIDATDMNQEAKGDFGAYSTNKIVDATLYNIRRERRNELCGEALRMDDLKRWRALDQMIANPYRVEGMLFWGSVYENDSTLMKKCIVDASKGNMSSDANSKYMLPYEVVTVGNSVYDNGGFMFTPAHYLQPIGMSVFRQTATDSNDFTTSVVYQNPGWEYKASTKPFDIY